MSLFADADAILTWMLILKIAALMAILITTRLMWRLVALAQSDMSDLPPGFVDEFRKGVQRQREAAARVRMP